MPALDVSEVLNDPDIAGDAFTVLRRTQTVNNYGEGGVATQTLPAFGSVQPTGDNSLVREEAYQVQANSITVYTTFPLRGPGKDAQGNSYQPDVVVWQGNHYLVKVVNDWSSFGTGFVQADCQSIDPVDLAPGQG